MEDNLPRGTTLLSGVVQVHFDGACQPARGGGVATYGFTVHGEGLEYEECGLAVPPGSPRATNNVAEYSAASRALEWLVSSGFRGSVVLTGDSQLVIRQMSGEYAVRTPHLKPYQQHLRQLAGRFETVQFVWVPRAENRRADELSKQALEQAAAELGRRKKGAPERLFDAQGSGGPGSIDDLPVGSDDPDRS
ncbi:MAG: ribonuclease HI [Thermoplasmata archaeon]